MDKAAVESLPVELLLSQSQLASICDSIRQGPKLKGLSRCPRFARFARFEFCLLGTFGFGLELTGNHIEPPAVTDWIGALVPLE